MKKLVNLFIVTLISLTTLGQHLDNEFYFRFGYSNPSWTQFGLTKEEWKAEGLENKVGANFELGNIFMINSLLSAENMAFGINVDYLCITHNNFSSGNSSLDLNFGHLRFGSKIGPSFTYSPVDKLEFDIYVKADIVWATAAAFYETRVDDAEDYFRAKIATGFSTGLNIRYGILMLGFEFNTISPELESEDYPGDFLGNNNDSSNKSPLPCTNFTLGLSF